MTADSVVKRLSESVVQLWVTVEDKQEFIGAGLVVADNLIVTAAHILVEAQRRGWIDGDLVGGRLSVYSSLGAFAGFANIIKEGLRLTDAEDVAFLDFLGDSSNRASGLVRPARLLQSTYSQGRPFISLGFPYSPVRNGREGSRFERLDFQIAHGTVVAVVPRGGVWRVVQLNTQLIEPGFSGCPVYDPGRRGVIGMVVDRRVKPGSLFEQAWAVPAEVLAELHTAITLQAVRRPDLEGIYRRERIRGAYPFIDRPSLGRELVDFLGYDQERVLLLRGFGGVGKTALVRNLLEKEEWRQRYPGLRVACFGFYGRESVQKMFEELWELVCEAGLSDASDEPISVGLGDLERAFKNSSRPWLIVLDGLERVQLPGSPPGIPRGKLMESADILRRLLRSISDLSHDSVWVLVTSRYSLKPDLGDYPGFGERNVGDLEWEEARNLLRALGFEGTESALDSLVGRVGRHALTLDLAGRYLAEKGCGLDPSVIPSLFSMEGLPEIEKKVAHLFEVLEAYKSILGQVDLTVVKLVSLFRYPVSIELLLHIGQRKGVLQKLQQQDSAPWILRMIKGGKLSLRQLKRSELERSLRRLVELRLISQESSENRSELYSAHPSIKEYFVDCHVEDIRGVRKEVARAFRFLLGRSELKGRIEPMEEFIFQEVEAGRVKEAMEIYHDYLDGYRYFGWQMGSPQRGLEIVSRLADGSGREFRAEVDAGLYAKNLGMIEVAKNRFERIADLESGAKKALALQNLSAVLVLRGLLPSAERCAYEALELAESIGDTRLEADCSVRVATALSLQDRYLEAVQIFRPLIADRREAERKRSRDWPEFRYAWLLARMGEVQEAEHVLRSAEKSAKDLGFEMIWARIATALSFVLMRTGRLEEAERYVAEVLGWLAIARDEEMYVLSQALKTELALLRMNEELAHAFIAEGLRYAAEGLYGLYWIDLKVLEARALVEGGSVEEAGRAIRAAIEGDGRALLGAKSPACGYLWGVTMATEIETEIRDSLAETS